MTGSGTPLPTAAELRILEVLWACGASTVRRVHDALAGEKAVQYTTVLRILQNMHGKGLVARDDRARSHVYAASVDRDRTTGGLIDELARRAFEGSTARLVMRALASQPASQEELDEIRAFLDEQEQGG